MENKVNDHAKKEIQKVPSKSKDELEKEAQKKELDDAVESVQNLYNEENEKE